MAEKQFTLEYRPFSLMEMVGQKTILNECKRRSIEGKWPQVMIFSGESGSGKTTLAFIVSALINGSKNVEVVDDKGKTVCYDPNPSEPSSEDIRRESFSRDVFFYDGSSMGKDDVLSLEEKVNQFPMYDNKRIIIIDEVQELASKASKGALLKLLEKPRDHVHFILCTMDDTKIPKAVLDRGQVYRFKKVSETDIVDYLVSVLKQENLFDTIDEKFLTEGIFVAAEAAQGSVRKALQNLERCVYGEYYTREQIMKEINIVTDSQANNVLHMLLKKDRNVFSEIANLASIEDFFYRSWTMLNDAEIFKITQEADSEWKKKYCEPISKLSTLNSLRQHFVSTFESCKGYFSNQVFMSYVVDYFNEEENIRVIAPNQATMPAAEAPKTVRRIVK